jgi:hypothetical protein
MRRHLVACTSAALLMATASPHVAAAKGPQRINGMEGGSPDDSEADLVRLGTACFLRAGYACACSALGEAYEREPRPATIMKVGLAELQADRSVEAVTHLHEYLIHSEEPADKLATVRTKWLPRAEALTARLEVVAPAGADIFLDGAAQGHAPVASIVMRTGPHDVMAKRGDQIDAQQVVAGGGDVVRVELLTRGAPDLLPPAPAVPSLPALATPLARPRESTERGVPRATWIAGVALGSAALAAAGIGVGLAAASWKERGNADALRRQIDPSGTATECALGGAGDAAACSRLDGTLHAQAQDTTISHVAYIAAGVLGAASVATWLFWRPGHARGLQMTARPSLSSRRAGFVVEGRW